MSKGLKVFAIISGVLTLLLGVLNVTISVGGFRPARLDVLNTWYAPNFSIPLQKTALTILLISAIIQITSGLLGIALCKKIKASVFRIVTCGIGIILAIIAIVLSINSGLGIGDNIVQVIAGIIIPMTAIISAICNFSYKNKTE